MNLYETIFKRKSCRNFSKEKLSNDELNNLKNFIKNTKALYPDIKTDYDLLSSEEIRTMLRWKSPHYLALYSEDKENYKVNIGFIYQQVDLYLQSEGIGSCWIGMGKAKKPREDLNHVILIGFGKSDKSIYREIGQFKRKAMDKITDTPSEELEVARLAPSAMNDQPWYFKKTADGYDVYCIKHNFIKNKTVGKWNPIDMGIALAHLYVSNKDSFRYFNNENPSKVKGFYYVGSISF